MTELIDRQTRIWAGVAVVVGVLALLAIEYREEPGWARRSSCSRSSTSCRSCS